MRARETTAPLVKFSIFAVVTVLATTLLAATIVKIRLTPTDTYRAVFSDVTSLEVGDDVRVAGVRVGEVEEIRIKDRTLAEVSFTASRDRPLLTSTGAVIRYRSLVGQRYIALTEGAGDGSKLPAGGQIPLSRTQPALDLNALLNGFKPLFAALSPKDVNQLATEIIKTFQGEGGTVNSLLAHTASLTTTLANRDKLIGSVITNLNKVLGSVDKRSARFSGLLSQLQRVISGLSADRKAIGDSLTGVNDLTGRHLGSAEGQPPGPEVRHRRAVRALRNAERQREDRGGRPEEAAAQAQQADRDGLLRILVQLLSVRLRRPGRTAEERQGAHPGDARGAGEVRPVIPFRERNPVTIGAVGLTTIALLVAAAFNVEDLPLIGSGDEYSAAFSEAGGLKSGDEVRIAGVKVGKVDEVDLDGDHVKVTFRVKDDPRFGTRTGASIRVKTILGAKYLSLEPEGPGQLEAGSEIPLKRTVAAYDVVEAFSDLTTTTEKVDTKRLASAMDTISQTFKDSPAEVKASINGLSRLSRTVAKRDQELGRTARTRQRRDRSSLRQVTHADQADQGRRQAVQGHQQTAGDHPFTAEERCRARRSALRPGRRQP